MVIKGLNNYTSEGVLSTGYLAGFHTDFWLGGGGGGVLLVM